MENEPKSEENGGKDDEIDVINTPDSSIESNTRVIIAKPQQSELQMARLKKLIAANEIRIVKNKEEKALARKELIEGGEINEIDLKTLLTKEDQDFYYDKKNDYLEVYPDLKGDPFDMDDLHQMIMEQIIQRSLLKKKKHKPYAAIEKEYSESIKRQENAKKSLSLRRTDRVKNKEKKQTVNIANLSLNFTDDDKTKLLLDRIKEYREEERRTIDLTDEEKVVE